MSDLSTSQTREFGSLRIVEVSKTTRSGMNHLGHSSKFESSKSRIKEGSRAKRIVATHVVGEKTIVPTLQMNRADLSTQGSGGHLKCEKRDRFVAPFDAAKGNKLGEITKRGFLKRRSDFRNAALFAEQRGTPLRLFITITWHACVFAGERKEGSLIGLPDEKRCTELRNRLRRKCQALGITFACIWARAVGARHGEHIHVFMACPFIYEREILSVIERVTGASLDPGSYGYPVIAASDCKGWLVVLNYRGTRGAVELAEDYLATQSHWHGVGQSIRGKAFGTSQAIGRTSRNAARWKNVSANSASNPVNEAGKNRWLSQFRQLGVA